MLKRRAAWPARTRWLIGIAAVVLAAAIVWALFGPLADLVARYDLSSAKPDLLQKARDAARGRLLTLAAGLFAAGALVFTALNFTLSRRTFELTEQGQVTDRYTKAIEQLGSDKLDVRIGGIYALERIARDSAKDHPTVMEVLTAFIREHSGEPWPPGLVPPRPGVSYDDIRNLPETARIRRAAKMVRMVVQGEPSPDNPPEQERLTRPDVQAAVTVIGRRNKENDRQRIDLSRAVLRGADLGGADFGGVTVRATELEVRGGARVYLELGGAVLRGAVLTGADLRGAVLTGEDLSSAPLTLRHRRSTDLAGADLTGADLTGADLHYTQFVGADLTGADLTGADLYHTRFLGVRLHKAVLTGADLTRANLGGADISGIKWPEGVQAPKGWIVDESGRLEHTRGQTK